MLLSTEDTCKEFIKKKAALMAEMAKLIRKEQEAAEKEKEATHNAEAVQLAAEKAARKEEEMCDGGVGS